MWLEIGLLMKFITLHGFSTSYDFFTLENFYNSRNFFIILMLQFSCCSTEESALTFLPNLMLLQLFIPQVRNCSNFNICAVGKNTLLRNVRPEMEDITGNYCKRDT